MRKVILALSVFSVLVLNAGCKKEETPGGNVSVLENENIAENQAYIVYFFNDHGYENISTTFTKEDKVMEVAWAGDDTNYYAVVNEPGYYTVTLKCNGYKDSSYILPLDDLNKVYVVGVQFERKKDLQYWFDQTIYFIEYLLGAHRE